MEQQKNNGVAAGAAPLPKIVTEFICPPIPVRQFDWCATYEDYEGGDPMGYGETREAAIADLTNSTCGHCGRADTYTGPCQFGGCPLGADL